MNKLTDKKEKKNPVSFYILDLFFQLKPRTCDRRGGQDRRSAHSFPLLNLITTIGTHRFKVWQQIYLLSLGQILITLVIFRSKF